MLAVGLLAFPFMKSPERGAATTLYAADKVEPDPRYTLVYEGTTASLAKGQKGALRLQNLTPHEVKTIVSRAGDGTKIILTGDPYQIDNPYLDGSSNGLSYLVERMKDQAISGHVTLRPGFEGYPEDGNGKMLDPASRLTSLGNHSNPVHQVLANYQDLENGGNGFGLYFRVFDDELRWSSAPS